MRASLVAQMVKNLLAMQETGSIPGCGRSPGEGNGNPLHYFCLENPMDRGAWQATVHEITKNQTQLKAHMRAQIMSNTVQYVRFLAKCLPCN